MASEITAVSDRSPTPQNPTFTDAAALKALFAAEGLPSGNTWLHKAIRDGIISPPIKIGGRNYWASETVRSDIAKWREQAVAAAERGRSE